MSTNAAVLSMATPRTMLTVDTEGVAADVTGSVTAIGEVLSDGSVVGSTSVDPATLAVEVLLRRFALRFETPEGTALETIQVTAGNTTEVVVVLTNVEALRPEETVPVTLTTAEVGVSTNAAVLSVTTPRAMLTVDTEGVAADVTGSVTATGVVVLSRALRRRTHRSTRRRWRWRFCCAGSRCGSRRRKGRRWRRYR